ncbi:MAG: glycosyltransferase [Bacteroidales bacterium]|nr:glycosyltransferase [Bacteroidales bacterium]
MKLCIIYNYALHYRSEIFQLLDKEYDCHFYFGNKYLDVKKMDYSLLKGQVTELRNSKLGPLLYQHGILALLKRYDTFLMIGNPRNLATWFFMLLSRLHRNKRIFFWCHGWYGKETKVESFLKHILDKMPTGIFLYGDYAKQLMIKEGFDANKLHVVHNSLAYSKQIEVRKLLKKSAIYTEHFNNDNKNLVFVGRLDPAKKLDMILKAIKQSAMRGRMYNMTYIGGGEDGGKLEALMKELGLEDRVWFYGPCYDETVLGDLLYNADLCVAPGNIGLTAMHSLVFGTPAMTHNCLKWQMPEFEAIKPGKTGDFFEMNDVYSLSIAIDKWFDDNGDKREIVRKACMKEIDDNWTPAFQMRVFKQYMH